jgi:hypothetical protein
MCVMGLKLIRRFLFAGVLCLGLTDLARADIIASISGPDFPATNLPSVSGIGAGRATQWQSSLAFEDVTVTADLSSLPGMTGTATAFLTTKVGPGTTAADEIAHATVSLSDFFAPSHTVTLFTGLDLAPADYYLSIVSATGGIWWMSDFTQAQTTMFPCNDIPCPVTIGSGAPAFPNWQMFTVAPNAYAPASVWTPFTFGLGEYHFAVTGTLADGPPTEPQPAPVPEPATLTLTLAGLVAAAVRRRRITAAIRGSASRMKQQDA